MEPGQDDAQGFDSPQHLHLERPGEDFAAKAGRLLGEHWKAITLLFWLGACIYMIGWEGWNAIQSFALGDTDDNIRMMQVRALLDGQGWYDLRQYRLNPPDGLNIHWSRIPDLPIAAIYLLLGIGGDGAWAERWAVAIAPLLPMLATMFAVAQIVRQQLGAKSFWLALVILFCAASTRSMFAPLRIDHHGWQLAALAWVMVGVVDRRRFRGGLITGFATAFSLAIGLEMLLYLALAGAAIVLFWVRDAGEDKRLLAYGVSLASGTAIGFLGFASNDNWAPVCDALTPVWLSVMLLAGAICAILSRVRLDTWWKRLGLAAVGGAVIVAFYAGAWPDCLTRLERVPPEADALWLSHVREAMPVYQHGWDTTIGIVTLPVVGFLGYIICLIAYRGEPRILVKWAALAATALLAGLLLLWQTRAAAAAQLLAVPGCVGFAWVILTWLAARKHMIVRVVGAAVVLGVVSGATALFMIPMVDAVSTPQSERDAEYRRQVGTANWRCPTFPALRPVAQQPAGLVLTFVDLGPRLVTVTPHNAIAGPYHRNGQAILDVMHAFRGDFATAREIIERRHVDYVLICPMMSESTIYRAETPNGFYARLAAGQVPDWLQPVQLPADSPYKMWRVRR